MGALVIMTDSWSRSTVGRGDAGGGDVTLLGAHSVCFNGINRTVNKIE